MIMAKMELYSDLLEKIEDEEKRTGKISKVSLNRIRKSIGWVEPVETEDVDAKLDWDVVIPDGGMVVNTQAEAEIISELVQIHERLKRIEKKLNDKE